MECGVRCVYESARTRPLSATVSIVRQRADRSLPCICTACVFIVCAVNGRRSAFIALSERDRDERIMLGCSPPCPQSAHTFVESMRAGIGLTPSSHSAEKSTLSIVSQMMLWRAGKSGEHKREKQNNLIAACVQFTSECVRKSIYSVNKSEVYKVLKSFSQVQTTILGAKADVL